eukprot:1962696-Pyramimonas_sp.AAC.1
MAVDVEDLMWWLSVYCLPAVRRVHTTYPYHGSASVRYGMAYLVEVAVAVHHDLTYLVDVVEAVRYGM